MLNFVCEWCSSLPEAYGELVIINFFIVIDTSIISTRVNITEFSL